MSPSLTNASSGTTMQTMRTRAPPTPPFSDWRLIPHLDAHFSTVGYHDGSFEFRAISLSKALPFAFCAARPGSAPSAAGEDSRPAYAVSEVTWLSCDSAW